MALRCKLLLYRFTHLLIRDTSDTNATPTNIPFEAAGLKGRTLELFLPFLLVTPLKFQKPLVRFALNDVEWRRDEKLLSENVQFFRGATEQLCSRQC